MKHHRPDGTQKHNRRNGFTIIELLIAMTLVTILLGSLAYSLLATLKTYDANDHVAQVTQTARVVLTRMSSELRTAENVTVTPSASTTTLTIAPPANPENITKIEYVFTKDTSTGTPKGTLKYVRTKGGASTSCDLLTSDDSVCLRDFVVTTQLGKDIHGLDAIVNISVNIQLDCGKDVSFPYTISVSPRRKQIY